MHPQNAHTVDVLLCSSHRATATQEIFRISIGRSRVCLAVLPGNRESIWPTQGKEGYFFIYYPPLSLLGRWHSELIGSASADSPGGDDEIWDTWLDLERPTTSLDAESASRRPHNVALTTPRRGGPPNR